MAQDRYSTQYLPAAGELALGAGNFKALDDIGASLDNLAQGLNRDALVGRVTQAGNQGTAEGLAGTPGEGSDFTAAGRAYNEAATRGYAAKVGLDLRAKAQEIGSQFSGMAPGDPEAARKLWEAHTGPVLAAVPERMRPAVEFEARERGSLLLGAVNETRAKQQFQNDFDAMKAQHAADEEDAMAAARDGNVEIGAQLIGRRAEFYAWQVQHGLMNPEEAAVATDKDLEAVQAESVFGSFVRSPSAGLIASIQNGTDPATKDLSLELRDRLVAKMSGELGRRHAEASRSEAAAAKELKAIRETVATKTWAAVYGSDEATRPTPDRIVKMQQDGLIGAEDAQQMLRTLSSPFTPKTDPATLDAIDRGIHDGEDMRPAIDEAVRSGVLGVEDAISLRNRNQTQGDKLLPDPVDENRKAVRDLFTESSPMEPLKIGETERRLAAVDVYDGMIREAQPGRNPETGQLYVDEAAERAYAYLRQKKRQMTAGSLRDIPPLGAAFSTKPGLSDAGVLDVAQTRVNLYRLYTERKLNSASLARELRLIQRWQDAEMAK